MVPKGGEYESDTQNLHICETRKLFHVSKSVVSDDRFANMKGYRAENSLTWFPSISGEYESEDAPGQNLDICETRKLYVSKFNFANMKATELKLHSHWFPRVENT